MGQRDKVGLKEEGPEVQAVAFKHLKQRLGKNMGTRKSVLESGDSKVRGP